jgi:hypothetical protein
MNQTVHAARSASKEKLAVTPAFRRIKFAVLGRDALATDRLAAAWRNAEDWEDWAALRGEDCPNFRSDSGENDREVISEDN